MQPLSKTTNAAVSIAVGIAGLLATGAVAQSREFPTLSPEHRLFLEEAELLLDKKARRSFLELEEEHERGQFIEAFWARLDPDPLTDVNEFRLDWARRVQSAREEFGVVDSDRARVFILNGAPDERIEDPCVGVLQTIDTWAYERSEQLDTAIVALFVDQNDLSHYRIWTVQDDPQILLRVPLDLAREVWRRLTAEQKALIPGRIERWILSARVGVDSKRVPWGLFGALNAADDRDQPRQFDLFLFFFTLFSRCPNEPRFAALVAETVGMSRFSPFAHLDLSSPKREWLDAEGDWLKRFQESRTALEASAAPLLSTIEVSYPGRHQSRTIVDLAVRVSSKDEKPESESEPRHSRFRINGEIFRGDALFETFHYLFENPTPSANEEGVAEADLLLSLRRFLRAGEFRLVLRIEDLESRRMARHELDLSVPRAVAAEADSEVSEALESVALDLEPGAESPASIAIEKPQEAQLSGYTRFNATVEGEVAKVSFLLDGKVVLSRARPPFTVEIDVGRTPRLRRLEAVAYGAAGQELARDALEINPGKHRFAVNLIEPKTGSRHSESLMAQAEVRVPERAVLEKVELYRGEELVATLFQPPFVQRIDIPTDGPLLVRCVATLVGGGSTEDVALVNARGNLETVRVHLVQLYASLTRNGGPIATIEGGQLKVLENGEPQELLRFERVRDLPLFLGVLLDTSGSMAERLLDARQAALDFFEQSVGRNDRVFVATFHERPRLRVPFTNDVEAMEKGLQALAAGQGTALYDSLVFALYQFQGIQGQKALLVLSDGDDRHSSFSFEDALEYARRSGVAVYSIGLTGAGPLARRKLSQIAEETGGRGVTIRDPSSLLEIYQSIEDELRSRYLIAYQSSTEKDDNEFRHIEVIADDPAVTVKSIAGYYP